MHTLFMIFLICWAFNIARSLINGKHKDPTAGRLTPTPNHAAVVAGARAAAEAAHYERLAQPCPFAKAISQMPENLVTVPEPAASKHERLAARERRRQMFASW
jgi:hypothetical protein